MHPWIEAMRLRTLPVSVAGVIVAVGYAAGADAMPRAWLPATLCLLFAVLAQVASNFANEYFDFRDGLDRAGRDGPRRGVTEGDITPRAMLAATLATLATACAIGCTLIYWGGWWLLPAGVVIALAVMAYSAGPYPLSRHGMGEVAVVCFFGLIPVCLTYYVLTGGITRHVVEASLAVGLMGANVLIVNNYRDADDDRAVGKHTLAVIAGRRFASALYLIDGVAAAGLLAIAAVESNVWIFLPIGLYLPLHVALWLRMNRLTGPRLNPLLGMTACLLLLTAVVLAVVVGIGK